jgi:predicted regulator of amino acid metabolism with ACT domain
LVDAYTESEQITAFFTKIDEHLVTPFAARVLGMDVVVTRIELTNDEQIVAVCRRGVAAQRIAILDLSLPAPPPDGVEWVHAFRLWARPTSSSRN